MTFLSSIYHFQGLIAGLLALTAAIIAAGITAYRMTKNHNERIEAEKAAAFIEFPYICSDITLYCDYLVKYYFLIILHNIVAKSVADDGSISPASGLLNSAPKIPSSELTRQIRSLASASFGDHHLRLYLFDMSRRLQIAIARVDNYDRFNKGKPKLLDKDITYTIEHIEKEIIESATLSALSEQGYLYIDLKIKDYKDGLLPNEDFDWNDIDGSKYYAIKCALSGDDWEKIKEHCPLLQEKLHEAEEYLSNLNEG